MSMLKYTICIICLIVNILPNKLYSQERSATGMTIDKNNYMKYNNLFPTGWEKGFINGWEGLVKPLSITINEAEPGGQPKGFLELSKKNKGVYGIDNKGYITGDYDYSGLPFPETALYEKDFATKIMWNHVYRYRGDDTKIELLSWTKKGAKLSKPAKRIMKEIYFINRMYDEPKPWLKLPIEFHYARIVQYLNENVATLEMRSLDRMEIPKTHTNKDRMYLYIPSKEKLIENPLHEETFVATPLYLTLLNSRDDGDFNDNVSDFKFKFVEEQDLLACIDAKRDIHEVKKMMTENTRIFYPDKNWSLRRAYVIEVTAKAPKTTFKRRVLYIDKESLEVLYVVSWDWAENIWKIWSRSYRRVTLPNGDITLAIAGILMVDVQFKIASFTYCDSPKVTGWGWKTKSFQPNNAAAW